MKAGAAELPIEVGELGNFEARMIRNFRTAIEDWEEVCSSLGQWEADISRRRALKSLKASIGKWVNELLSWGELIARQRLTQPFPIPRSPCVSNNACGISRISWLCGIGP